MISSLESFESLGNTGKMRAGVSREAFACGVARSAHDSHAENARAVPASKILLIFPVLKKKQEPKTLGARPMGRQRSAPKPRTEIGGAVQRHQQHDEERATQAGKAVARRGRQNKRSPRTPAHWIIAATT